MLAMRSCGSFSQSPGPQAESIRTFRILAQPFTEEHGLLTPSLKLKRKAIENTYAGEVEALYRA